MHKLLDHLNDKNPRFHCQDFSGNVDGIFNLTNKTNDGESRSELIRQILGGKAPIYAVDIFNSTNGFTLYCIGKYFGINVFSINQVIEMTKQWKNELSDNNKSDISEFDNNAIIIGETSLIQNKIVLLDNILYVRKQFDDPSPIAIGSWKEFFDGLADDPIYQLNKYELTPFYFTPQFSGKQMYPIRYIYEPHS